MKEILKRNPIKEVRQINLSQSASPAKETIRIFSICNNLIENNEEIILENTINEIEGTKLGELEELHEKCIASFNRLKDIAIDLDITFSIPGYIK